MPDPQRLIELAFGAVGNMDDIFSVIFLLMVVFTFLGDTKKKKPTISPPTSGEDFDIPMLPNDPNISVQEEVVVQPSEKIVPRGVTNNVTERYRRQYEQRKREDRQSDDVLRSTESEERSGSTERSGSSLSSDDALDAMILSEVFGKPKALRRR